MVGVVLIVSDLAYGLLLGGVLAILAYGLNLIWGAMNLVNIAHGEFIMLGAYAAYFLNLYYGLNPLFSIPVDVAFGFGAGYVLYYSIFHRELKGKEAVTPEVENVTLLATFGLSLFIANLAAVIFTPDSVGIHWSLGIVRLGEVVLPVASLAVFSVALALMGITHFFLVRTYIGTAIRGYMQDITAIKLMGINPTRVVSLATALGVSLAMAGGALVTAYEPGGITPFFGDFYTFLSFVVVVLGGKGKMLGCFVGGLVIGVVENLGQAFVPVNIAQAAAFLILIPVLVLVPEGIVR